MQIIVATDIHGVHDGLRAQLAVLGQPVIVSPWPGEGNPFANEQEAATAFHQQDGLSSYERRIAEVARGEPSVLIGFSVGATSLWRYVASPHCTAASLAFLYYGSRIRDYRTLVPRCQTSVYFAEHEISFKPESLVDDLGQSGVMCSVLAGTYHGFMNPASHHFRSDIANEHLRMLLCSIREHARHPQCALALAPKIV